MQDIYIPIDYSNAKEKIPSGEDIIYSTLMKVTSGTPAYKSKWISHVLMTTKGIAYTVPQRKSPPIGIYHSWKGIYGIWRKQFQIGGTYFKLERDPNYESKESFKMRTKVFASTIKPINKAYKENYKSEKEAKKK
jgi:hypothetical protein